MNVGGEVDIVNGSLISILSTGVVASQVVGVAKQSPCIGILEWKSEISVIVNASVHVHIISKGLYIIDLDVNELWLSQKLKKINAKQKSLAL